MMQALTKKNFYSNQKHNSFKNTKKIEQNILEKIKSAK